MIGIYNDQIRGNQRGRQKVEVLGIRDLYREGFKFNDTAN